MAQGREIAIFMFLIILFFLEKRFPHTLFQFEPHKRENDDGFKDKIFVSLVSVVCFPRFVLGCSVTRFGEISPLWQNFMNLCPMVEVLFSVFGKILNLLWQNSCVFGQPMFQMAKFKILKNK